MSAHGQMLLCRDGQAQDPKGCEGGLKRTSGAPSSTGRRRWHSAVRVSSSPTAEPAARDSGRTEVQDRSCSFAMCSRHTETPLGPGMPAVGDATCRSFSSFDCPDGLRGSPPALGRNAEATRRSATVHAPHCPSPHPYFVPVSPISSRRTNRSGVSASEWTGYFLPFTSISIRLATVFGHPAE